MKRPLILILLISICQLGKAQSLQDTLGIINQFFHRYQPENPGGQLAISRNGKLIFSKAWGLADIEHHVPFTTETVSEAGSISKQFTAASILLLEQQGKLSLNDDVRKYIPEFPGYGSVIRLSNLLHHTSGLREWSDLEAITGWPRTTKAYRNEDVLHMLCRQKGLNNQPGTEFIYSNSNYILLTIIVERVSGMTLPDFTKKYIFEPAGMNHTSWRDDYKKVVPNRAIAYSKNGGIYKINMPFERVYGPGGLLTTTEDLLKWNNFYLNNKLGSPGLLSKQLAIEPIPGGIITNYAAGLFIGDVNGVRRIFHDGQTAGYVGIVENFPSLQLSIAWLSNTTEFKAGLFDEIDEIQNLFIKDNSTQTLTKNSNAPRLSVSTAQKYTGWYAYSKTNQGINIKLINDTLFFDDTPLIPINDTEFIYKASKIKFNGTHGFMLSTPDNRQLTFTKEADSKITAENLEAYTGTYYSQETESSFSIILNNNKLMLEKDYIKDAVLSPTYDKAFNFYLAVDGELNPVSVNVIFESDNKNITGCKISTSDARNIVFEKIK